MPVLSYEDGIPAGVTEFMLGKEKAAFYRMAGRIVTEETDTYVLIKPLIYCQVKYRNFTKTGKLRLPVFQYFT